MSDVIDRLAGVKEGTALDLLRRRRPVTRDHERGSWQALFQPQVPGTVTLQERNAVAMFVAAVSGDDQTAGFYRAGLLREGGGTWASAVDRAAGAGATQGPYGRYDAHADLRDEGREGLRFRVDDALRPLLGGRLSAALDHAHRIVFRPRESSPDALNALGDAGWSVTDVVTLSLLVAFVTYQIRVAAGPRVLGEVVR